MKSRARIFIIDSYLVVCSGIRQLLNPCEDLLVCGEAHDRAGALAGIAATHPALVLLEPSLTTGSGLGLLKDVRAQYPAVFTLIFTEYEGADAVARSLRAGAHGYIHKTETGEALVAAIRTVLAGGQYISPVVADNPVDGWLPRAARSPLAQLSDCEWEIFKMLGRGYAINRIAKLFDYSASAMRAHCDHIKLRMNVRSTHKLVVLARQYAEISPPTQS